MPVRYIKLQTALMSFCALQFAALLSAQAPPSGSVSDLPAKSAISFSEDVEPLLRKYCGDCHSGLEREGDFSLQTFQDLAVGNKNGPVFVANQSSQSKLVQLLRGSSEPKMPPDDHPQPTAAEIDLIANWIDLGAVGPEMASLRDRIRVPAIESKYRGPLPVTSAAAIPNQPRFAVGHSGRVEIVDSASENPAAVWDGFPGKVNSIRFTADGQLAVVGSGIEGVGGQVDLIDVATGKPVLSLQGHSDIIYGVAISPDRQTIATAGYDRQIWLWDVGSKQLKKKLLGHNGAVYDLDFDPSGKYIASASADETVKIWDVATGERMHTLSQGEKEQYSVRFSPDGRYLFAGGADRKIRKWEIVSWASTANNPLRASCFAHEGSVIALRVSPDGKQVVSIGQDREAKVWDSEALSLIGSIAKIDQRPAAVDFVTDRSVCIVPTRGARLITELPTTNSAPAAAEVVADKMEQAVVSADETPSETLEIEPSESTAGVAPVAGFQLANAQLLKLPAIVRGELKRLDPSKQTDPDADYFRFQAKAGEKWIFEIDAVRSKSPVDSRLEILDVDGKPIQRVVLQAVRETYFTFRGKDNVTADDFRLHKWEEMELNEFLYAGGEVVRLWLYPRGPDSGFKVYPGEGNRRNYFDTTPTSHALGEVAYIVRPLSANEKPQPNGLPVFPLYFENDDDSLRRWGSDSRLEFTAPSDGEYVVRVRDSRGFDGEGFTYKLTARRPKPDFSVTLETAEVRVPNQRGREFIVTAERFDDYEGPISVRIEGLVPGMFVTTDPLIIPEGQRKAIGTIYAADPSKLPQGAYSFELPLVASANIGGQLVEHQLDKPLKIASPSAEAKPEVAVRIEPMTKPEDGSPVEIVVRAGTTTTAKVVVERNGFEGPVSFGNEDCGRNLPHGVFVDNIGLNGLLIPEQQSEREFFITAAPWVKEQVVLFHLRSQSEGNPTSLPVRLRIVR